MTTDVLEKMRDSYAKASAKYLETAVQMLAGFAILAGSAVFYSNQSRYMQGSATILVAASMSWVAVILIAIRVVSGTAYVSGVLTIFLVLAPLLSTIGSVWNLISGETKSIKR